MQSLSPCVRLDRHMVRSSNVDWKQCYWRLHQSLLVLFYAVRSLQYSYAKVNYAHAGLGNWQGLPLLNCTASFGISCQRFCTKKRSHRVERISVSFTSIYPAVLEFATFAACDVLRRCHRRLVIFMGDYPVLGIVFGFGCCAWDQSSES